MSRGRGPRLAVAAVAALAACRGGPAARPHDGAGAGRSVVIHAGRDGVTGGRAHVDDRSWREVPASGELELGPVPARLELESVVVESISDPGGLRARSCHVISAADGLAEPGWLWGRTITFVLRDGAVVRGRVLEVGEPVAVIDDGEVRARVPVASLRHDLEEDDESPGRPPRPGDDVFADDGEGNEAWGTFAAVIPDHLAIESGGARRVIDADTIARISVDGVPAAPTLRCAVAGARPGRHLVRVAYATPGLTWRAAYQVIVEPPAAGVIDDVRFTPSFDITATDLAAPWPARVRLVLGVPGEPEPPVTVWEGDATLGGGTVHVAGEPVRRRARVDLVYRGAVEDDAENPRFSDWRSASRATVVRELALQRLVTDAPGPLRVGVRDPAAPMRWLDGELPMLTGPDPSLVVRVPLAVASDLVGFRRKLGRAPDATRVVDDVTFSVANRSDRDEVVVIEEPVRNVARPTLLYARLGETSTQGDLLRDRWRASVTVPAGALMQGQVVLQYRFRRY